MSVEFPVFPVLRSWDYACFQVLEEATKHQREMSKSMDSIRSKLQKPICKDDDLSKTQKGKEKKWWNNALLFLKGSSTVTHPLGRSVVAGPFRASVSGPLYVAYDGSWPNKTYRTTRTPSSRPLPGGITPACNCQLKIPYLNLNDLNAEEEQMSFTSRLPIYFVT